MINTSYFSNWRKFPEDKIKISISRFPPKWAKIDLQINELAPSADLLNRYKNNLVSEEEYDIEYNEQLRQLDPIKIKEKIGNGILLCYEKKGNFCHRNLVKKWLNENDIECEELD